jgi:hypothetical protein
VRGARRHPPIVARYEFWAVLASPLKRVVPFRYRAAVRRLLGVATS